MQSINVKLVQNMKICLHLNCSRQYVHIKYVQWVFSGSGDHMVQVTDKILENLENVNDCLVKSNNKEDMRPGRVLRPFLERWSRRIDLDKDYCWGGSFLCRT